MRKIRATTKPTAPPWQRRLWVGALSPASIVHAAFLAIWPSKSRGRSRPPGPNHPSPPTLSSRHSRASAAVAHSLRQSPRCRRSRCPARRMARQDCQRARSRYHAEDRRRGFSGHSAQLCAQTPRGLQSHTNVHGEEAGCQLMEGRRATANSTRAITRGSETLAPAL